MSAIATFLFIGCGLFGLFFGCPSDGSTERVQIRNEEDTAQVQIRNEADVAQTQFRTMADIETAKARAEAQIEVARAEAEAASSVARAQSDAQIAFAVSASEAAQVESTARVAIHQAWATALILVSVGVALAAMVCIHLLTRRAPHSQPQPAQWPAIDGPTWRALESQAAQRGQRLEMRGSTMLLVDNRTNAIVAQREVS